MGRASASSKRSRMLLVSANAYFAPARTAVVPGRAQLFKKMAKTKSTYSCTECGGPDLEMAGSVPALPGMEHARGGYCRKSCVTLHAGVRNGPGAESERGGGGGRAALFQGMAEFDRVLGGGLVHGGVVLLGGDPGSANPRCCCKRYVICRRCRDERYCMSAARNRRARWRYGQAHGAGCEGGTFAGGNPAGKESRQCWPNANPI